MKMNFEELRSKYVTVGDDVSLRSWTQLAEMVAQRQSTGHCEEIMYPCADTADEAMRTVAKQLGFVEDGYVPIFPCWGDIITAGQLTWPDEDVCSPMNDCRRLFKQCGQIADWGQMGDCNLQKYKDAAKAILRYRVEHGDDALHTFERVMKTMGIDSFAHSPSLVAACAKLADDAMPCVRRELGLDRDGYPDMFPSWSDTVNVATRCLSQAIADWRDYGRHTDELGGSGINEDEPGGPVINACRRLFVKCGQVADWWVVRRARETANDGHDQSNAPRHRTKKSRGNERVTAK